MLTQLADHTGRPGRFMHSLWAVFISVTLRRFISTVAVLLSLSRARSSRPVVHPEVLAGYRGWIEGIQWGFLKSGEGPSPSPGNFWILKVKMVCTFKLDFKVCRLPVITETVSDHIRKTTTNHLCFPLLFQSLRRKNQEVLRQRIQAALLSYTSLQDCSRHCSWYIEMEEGQV